MALVLLLTLAALSVVSLALNWYLRCAHHPQSAGKKAPKSDDKANFSDKDFLCLQKSLFLAYFPMLLADWLQSPYTYRLYEFYGFGDEKIAILYAAGYASSTGLGLLYGSMADRYGRRRAILLFIAVYIGCCFTKISSMFGVLLLGRVLGGISTPVLFEAWYVSEHTIRHKFEPDWMASTFSTCTMWNGFLAVVAGILSEMIVQNMDCGPVSPFILSTLPAALSMVVIASSWQENYGNNQSRSMESFTCGIRAVFEDANILKLSFAQMTMETCMYIVASLWTPVLKSISSSVGLIFSCLMVAIITGSTVFSALTQFKVRPEKILLQSTVLMFGGLAMCVLLIKPGAAASTALDLNLLLLAFIVVEVSLGMYLPTISLLKSQLIPEKCRASVMSLLRIPTNVVTLLVLMTLHFETFQSDKSCIFFICLILVVPAILCAKGLCGWGSKVETEIAKSNICV